MNTGSGFTRLLEAEDTEFSGGYGGIEGSGNITRLTKFKVAVPLSAVPGMSSALRELSLVDPFSSTEPHLSGGGSWGALQWDTSTSGYATGRVGALRFVPGRERGVLAADPVL